jgi:hypothetical protein
VVIALRWAIDKSGGMALIHMYHVLHNPFYDHFIFVERKLLSTPRPNSELLKCGPLKI